MSAWIALSLWSLVQIAFRFAEIDNKNENEMKLVNALTFVRWRRECTKWFVEFYRVDEQKFRTSTLVFVMFD